MPYMNYELVPKCWEAKAKNQVNEIQNSEFRKSCYEVLNNYEIGCSIPKSYARINKFSEVRRKCISFKKLEGKQPEATET